MDLAATTRTPDSIVTTEPVATDSVASFTVRIGPDRFEVDLSAMIRRVVELSLSRAPGTSGEELPGAV